MSHSLRICALIGWIGVLSPLPALAQDEASGSELAPTLGVPSFEAAAEGVGAIAGTVFSNADASPVAGVEATLVASDGAERGSARTDDAGSYRFDDVPAGTYSIRFAKPGFRNARMTEFPVVADQVNPGDFAISPEVAASDSGVEEIVITAERKIPVADRPNADELINTMDTVEIGKFAASDIGEAIKRIPGINVVEGQFAIIRGLEDRYSSTLFNSAPVPSPDPESQSVQLDLFPSEITSNLVVSKTFAPDLPSNSSGGSINVLTQSTPEDLEFKLSVGTGFNENARDRFVQRVENSPIGSEASPSDVTEGEFGALIGWRTMLAERELSVRALVNWELDYQTKIGFQENREPRPAQIRLFPAPATVVSSGDLSLGELNLSGGRFEYTDSEEIRQTTAFLALGLDLDTDGNHHVDFSTFYTLKEEDAVQVRENGYLPGFDYSTLAAIQQGGGSVTGSSGSSAGVYSGFATLSSWLTSVRPEPSFGFDNGPLWFANFTGSRAFEQRRDLLVYQLNGTHEIDSVPGLRATWAANHAITNQEEGYFAARYFFEPSDPNAIPSTFPVESGVIAPGQFVVNGHQIFGSMNDVEETQNFARLDVEYERDIASWLVAKLSTGVWYEHAQRDVAASYLETPAGLSGPGRFSIVGATPTDLGGAIAPGMLTDASGSFEGSRDTTNDSQREIFAFSLGGKATLFEQLDLLAGFRREHIQIATQNDPFIGEFNPDGSPRIFPSAYLFFDRPDNPARSNELPAAPGTIFNDQILGIDVPIDPTTGFVDLVTENAIRALVNTKIDETRILPSAGVTYRPLDGLSLRAAYSQTVARPAFREIGYYVAVESGSDDLVIGNPQLGLSDVESWDLRVEYNWGDFGDLAALSAFTKTIDDPIESIVLRNPVDASTSSALYRTFFNNPNPADLWGIELEGRKALDFLGIDGLEYVSLAANFTYIDASVDRTDVEIQRARDFFGVAPGDQEKFASLSKSRRLFSQPEWIANADITFDQPDWGTRATLAFFGISDVLDAAGSANLGTSGRVESLTLDRYLDSYHQLDLIFSQRIFQTRIPGELVFKASVKNLTDSERRLIWDPSQTARKIVERAFRIGRDLSVSLSYSHSF
ncbi:MAG: TonB-dependent receptor domain-containing protein [Myxococcota bacterium]